MKKRLLAMVLTVAMCLSLLPVSALAAPSQPSRLTAPTKDQVVEILNRENAKRVEVYCITEDDHDSEDYAVTKGSIESISEPYSWYGWYYCTVTISATDYIAKYATETDNGDAYGTHTALSNTKTLTLWYDSFAQIWKAFDSSAVSFAVKCTQSTPTPNQTYPIYVYAKVVDSAGGVIVGNDKNVGVLHGKDAVQAEVNTLGWITLGKISDATTANPNDYSAYTRKNDGSLNKNLQTENPTLYNAIVNAGTSAALENYTKNKGLDTSDVSTWEVVTANGATDYDVSSSTITWHMDGKIVAYKVTYDANGGTGTYRASDYYLNGASATVKENMFTAPAGKEFAGWNTQASGGEATAYAPGAKYTVNGEDVTLYAQWKDLPTYSTAYSWTNVDKLVSAPDRPADGSGFATEDAAKASVDKTDYGKLAGKDGYYYTFSGWTAGTTVNYTVPFTGNWAKTNEKVADMWVTVTFQAGANGSLSGTTSYDVLKNTAWSSITVPTPTPNAGYHFDKWTPAFPETITESKTYTASFAPNTDTAYKVEHYQQNLANDNYTLKYTDNLTGTTGATTAAVAKTYEGFTAKDFEQKTIAGDGKTVVKIYYDRNTYTVSYDYGTAPTGASTLPDSASYKYGATVTVADKATADHYIFNGWTSPDGVTVGADNTFTMPAKNVEFTGTWTYASSDVTLTFDANGGAWISAVDGYAMGTDNKTAAITGTGSVKLMQIPTFPMRNGYVFDGWYDSAEGGSPVLFLNQNLYVSTTVYAHWKDAGSQPTTNVNYNVTQHYVGVDGKDVHHVDIKDLSAAPGTPISSLIGPDYAKDLTDFGSQTYIYVAADTKVNAAPLAEQTLTGGETIHLYYYLDSWKDADKTPTEGDKDSLTGGDGTPDCEQIVVKYVAYNENGTTDPAFEVITPNPEQLKNVAVSGSTATPAKGLVFDYWTDPNGNTIEGSKAKLTNQTIAEVTLGSTYTYTAYFFRPATFDPDKAPFNDPEKPELKPIFLKNLTGNLPSGFEETFTITLKGGMVNDDGVAATNMEYTGTVTMDKATEDGVFNFVDSIVFTQDGRYQFTVKETKGTTNYIGYDDSEYTLNIIVGVGEDESTAEQLEITHWYITSEGTEEVPRIEGQQQVTFQNKSSYNPGGGGGGNHTKYTLTYETNGGSDIASTSHTKNTVVKLDKVPNRENYTFTGWYSDKELTKKITEIKMTSDKTVYAGWEATEVPGMLNGDDHFAYVIGYPGGDVEPMGNITRAEVATIFFRLLKDDIRDGNLTSTNVFTDVNAGDWFNTAISTMAKLGIVNGRSADTFAPNAPITRAEFATICARFDTSIDMGASNFTDLTGHWAKEDIEHAVSLGWIMGYEDGTFRPNNLITRAEAMTMINRVLCRMPETPDDLLSDMLTWPDNMDTSKWYYLAIQEATNSHDFKKKGEVNETWTKLTQNPDWSRYQ